MSTDAAASTGSVLGNMQRAAEGASATAEPDPQTEPDSSPADAQATPETDTDATAAADGDDTSATDATPPGTEAAGDDQPADQPPGDEQPPDLFDFAGDESGALRQQFGGDQGKFLESLFNARQLVGKHSEELSEYRKLREQIGAEGIAALQAGKQPGDKTPDSKNMPTWGEFQLLQQQIATARQNNQDVPADLERRYNEAAEMVGQASLDLAARHPVLLEMIEAFQAGKFSGVDQAVLDQRLAETDRQRSIDAWGQRHRAKFYDDAGKVTVLGKQVAVEARDLCRLYSQETGTEMTPQTASVALWEKALANVQSRQQPPKRSPPSSTAAARKPDAAPPDKVPQTAAEWFKKDKGDPKTALFRFYTQGPGKPP